MTDLSVLMPVYNASRYPEGWVERAIDSVLCQPEIDIELCIGDDGSDDNYLWRFTDPRIKVVSASDKPQGGSTATNAAASIASGRYFIILSCRSWYEQRALTAMVRYLDNNPDIGFVWGNTFKCSPQGQPMFKEAAPFNPALFMRDFVTSFGYMYRREAWDRGARYGCDVQTKDGRWLTIGDHWMQAQLILMDYKGAPMQMQVLYYQYGGIEQSNDLLQEYRPALYEEFSRLVKEFTCGNGTDKALGSASRPGI